MEETETVVNYEKSNVQAVAPSPAWCYRSCLLQQSINSFVAPVTTLDSQSHSTGKAVFNLVMCSKTTDMEKSNSNARHGTKNKKQRDGKGGYA